MYFDWLPSLIVRIEPNDEVIVRLAYTRSVGRPNYSDLTPGGEIANGMFYNIAHQILEAGSSRGAAFPSSHVGVSFAQTALTFVLLKRWAPIVAVLSAGLAVGSVYGGFHYATDASIGLLYGLLLFFIAPHLAQLVARDT